MNINKKSFLVGLILLLSIIFVACSKNKVSAEETVSMCFNSIKSGKISGCQQYLETDEKLSEKVLPNEDEVLKDIFEKAYTKLDYKIEEVVVNKKKGKAQVRVTIDTPDFIELIAQSADEAYASTSEDEKNDDFNKTMVKIMTEKIDKNDIKKRESSITINLINKKGKWKIKPNKNFFIAITGGLQYMPKIFG